MIAQLRLPAVRPLRLRLPAVPPRLGWAARRFVPGLALGAAIDLAVRLSLPG